MRAHDGRRRRVAAAGLAGLVLAFAGCGGGGGGGGGGGFSNAHVSGEYVLARLGVTGPGAGAGCGGLPAGDTRLASELRAATADGAGGLALAPGFTSESCGGFGPAAPEASSYLVYPTGEGVFAGGNGRLADAAGAVVLLGTTSTSGQQTLGVMASTQATGLSTASLDSAYGFASLGLEAPSGTPGDIQDAAAVAARVVFAGDGTFTFELVAANVRSAGLPGPGCPGCAGTYSVAPDGAMTMAMTHPTYGFALAGRVAAVGSLRLLTEQGAPGVYRLAVLLPTVGPFSAESSMGTYQVVDMRLQSGAGPSLDDRWVILGQLTTLSDSSVTLAGTLNTFGGGGTSGALTMGAAGVPFSRNLSGAFVVDPSGEITIDGGNVRGFLRSGGDAFVAIGVTDPGAQQLQLGFRR